MAGPRLLSSVLARRLPRLRPRATAMRVRGGGVVTWRMFVVRNLPTFTGYALRRLVVRPAPTDRRCIVGSVVHPGLWCPRRADTALVCRRHR